MKLIFSVIFIISSIIHPESVTTLNSPETIFVSEIGRFYQRDGAIVQIVKQQPKRVLKGLVDPKGITIYRDKLWITDIDKVVSYSLSDSGVKVMKRGRFKPAPLFLNDICASEENLYVSDTEGNLIYKVRNGMAIKLINISRANGISYTEDRAFFASFTKPGRIYSYKKNHLEEFFSSEDINLTDGLTIWKKEGILFASGFGAGNIVAISIKSGEKVGIIKGLLNPADIFFDEKTHILFVPEMGKNRVIAYKVSVRIP